MLEPLWQTPKPSDEMKTIIPRVVSTIPAHKTGGALINRQALRSKTHFLNLLFLAGCLLALGSCSLIPDSWAGAITGASKAMALDGNSLYHQTDEISLEPGELEVAGGVKSPGRVNLNNHYKKEVFIKEARYYRDTGTEFIGSYRYRGYSLFDLLHPLNQEKKNAEEFHPSDFYADRSVKSVAEIYFFLEARFPMD
jgi:hypothetical protein